LKQLIEQYPDTDVYEQAYLHLADATMEVGLNAEAARLYQRLYNFAFPSKSKTLSALRAARCLYETQAYEEAIKWLMRYFNLAKDDEPNNLYSAYFLLGRTNLALKKYQEACDAFQHILVKESSRELNIEAIVALVQIHIEQENFVEALDALENIRSIALSQEQSIEMSLLRSKIFRMLGLTDMAIVSLRDMTKYVSDTQLNARISFELAQCHMAKGDLEHARSSLSEILYAVEPGPLAQEAALALADACIRLDQDAQAVSVCLQLLDSNLPAERRQESLKTLAAAYSKQKKYNKAALTLSGQWK
jgi:tetratricopeptide (TPR) repeat protein